MQVLCTQFTHGTRIYSSMQGRLPCRFLSPWLRDGAEKRELRPDQPHLVEVDYSHIHRLYIRPPHKGGFLLYQLSHDCQIHIHRYTIGIPTLHNCCKIYISATSLTMPTGNDISIIIRDKPWQVATVQARIELGGRLVISYSIRKY